MSYRCDHNEWSTVRARYEEYRGSKFVTKFRTRDQRKRWNRFTNRNNYGRW